MQNDPFLTDIEAAEFLGISVHTLRNFRRKVIGGGPEYTKFGDAVRYRRSWLEDYANQNRCHSAA